MTEAPEELWHEGVNQTADAVVLSGDHILLIQRGDGSWAFPGGFVDEGETTAHASLREAFEETAALPTVEPWLGYSGQVDDPRNTEKRWIETDAWVYECDSMYDVTANDDAHDVRWWSLHDIETLYASHADILDTILRQRALHELVETTPHPSEVPVKPGHMGYHYQLFRHIELGSVFSKSHNPEFFSDTHKAERSRLYLAREHDVMQHMKRFAPQLLPDYFELYGDHLVMHGLDSSDGWHWQLPETTDDQQRYVKECLEMLESLEATPITPEHPEILPSIVSFYEEGWPTIETQQIDSLILLQQSYKDSLHPTTYSALSTLLSDVDRFKIDERFSAPIITNAHHDARQANIAWHAEHGPRLVDWSWSGPGAPGSDTTSFLIDLKKSEFDVSPYMNRYFNADHAKLLIGFWLAHALLPSRKGNESVRLHQLASAGAAASLLLEGFAADSPV